MGGGGDDRAAIRRVAQSRARGAEQSADNFPALDEHVLVDGVVEILGGWRNQRGQQATQRAGRLGVGGHRFEAARHRQHLQFAVHHPDAGAAVLHAFEQICDFPVVRWRLRCAAEFNHQRIFGGFVCGGRCFG